MSRNLTELVRAARRVSTPILGITTSDPQALRATLVEAINGNAPMLDWDCNRGLLHLNTAGKQALNSIPPAERESCVVPQIMLEQARKLPEETVVFMQNAALFIREPNVIQAIANLRDEFKMDRRTLILLSPSFELPAALHNDVVLLEEELPGEAELRDVCTSTCKDAGLEAPTAEVLDVAVSAARGLSRFAAEQVYAMSLRESGVDLDDVWLRKKAAIDQTRGLSFHKGGITYDDLGGLQAASTFGKRLAAGDDPPDVYVRIDEIEKMWAGASGGDLSGVSQDQLGAFLRAQEDNGWDGMILVGPPGSGKTAFSVAMAASAGKPRLDADFGAAKGSLVGQSEEQVREMIRVIKGIGGSKVFIVATCNKLESLPPELRRRFTSGIWFFDLPTATEREAIWKIQLAAHGLAAKAERPNDANWTGAEIRNVCRTAKRLKCSPKEAAAFIVPVMTSSPGSVMKLREVAAGSFLSASHAGVYTPPDDVVEAPAAARRLSVRPEKG